MLSSVPASPACPGPSVAASDNGLPPYPQRSSALLVKVQIVAISPPSLKAGLRVP
jgi:hypothetical protein